MDKKELCQGCRNEFYNGQNDLGIKECWSFRDSKVVSRFKIGWWTPQDKASNFHKVQTLTCHHAPGKYALSEELPQHLR